MGQFNELLGQGARFTRLIARVFGMGEQLGATTISPEIMPVFSIEPASAELRSLAGDFPCVGFADVDPGVADRARVRLGNADNGPLIISDHVHLWAPALVEVTLRIHDIDLPSNGTKRFLDRRRADTGDDPAARFQTEAGTESATTIIGRYPLLANTLVKVRLPLILPPVTTRGFMLQTETDDVRMIVIWHWRERQAHPSELTI